jgi:hypothetical protein
MVSMGTLTFPIQRPDIRSRISAKVSKHAYCDVRQGVAVVELS